MYKAAVIGYGKSGRAAERLLKIKGFAVDIYDDSVASCYEIADFKDEYSVVSVSPGIDIRMHPPLAGVCVTGEIDIAYSMLPTGAKVLVVTGTNGKSTVTYLTQQLLESCGVHAIACGNIGKPFAEAVLEGGEGTVFVLELSSFQIELLSDFAADAVAIINLSPEHLDRYDSYGDYVEAKLRILNFIPEGGFLVADPDVIIVNKAISMRASVQYMDSELSAFPQLKGGRLSFVDYFLDVGKFPLPGGHNLLNLAFAAALVNVVVGFRGDITPHISGLKGLPHRLETVFEGGGVVWVNDSKATNVSSVNVALGCFESDVFIMLGGKDKLSDYTVLIDEINRCGKTVVLFGAGADKIEEQLSGQLVCDMVRFSSLKGAVEWVYREAKRGDTVLLSPGCASYDEFKNFEERGEKFRCYIEGMAFR